MKKRKPVLGFIVGAITGYMVLVGIELLFKHLSWFNMEQRSIAGIFYEGIFASLLSAALMLVRMQRRAKKLQNN